MEEIRRWIESNTPGSGYGSGSGYGYGSGYGSGSGSGYGLKTFDGKTVYRIDNIPTIITSVKLALAKGFILETDLSLTPCYIAKGNGYFAHGKTVNEAREALQAKILENMDTEETITRFLDTFKKGERYPGKDFFEWHHYLTGSCLMGRENFVHSNGLSLDALYTVDEFIALCENAYGGETIKLLKERYNT